MARGTTGREIIDQALYLADQQDESAAVTNAGAQAGFIERAKALVDLNHEIYNLYHALTEAHEEYNIDIREFSLVPNQEEYDLPTDFYKHRKIFFKQSGKRYRIYRFTLDEIPVADRVGFPGTVWGFGFRYRLTGDKIRFIPVPNSGSPGTIEHWYVPEAPKLKSEDEQLPRVFPVGWEHTIITGVAIKMLAREESDTSALKGEYMMALQRNINDAAIRDAGEPNRVNDTSERWASSRYWRWGE